MVVPYMPDHQVFPQPETCGSSVHSCAGRPASSWPNGLSHALVEHSPLGILLTRPDGAVLSANPAACRMFGMIEAEICVAGRAGLVDPTDPRLDAYLRDREQTGAITGCRLRLRRKDGTRFEAEVSSVIFTDADGQPATSMMLQDISVRVQMEEALRVSERTVTSLLNASPDPIMLLDCRGHILALNTAMAQRFGKAPAELLQMNAGALADPATNALRMRHAKEVIRTGQACSFEEEIADLVIEHRYCPLHDNQGQVTGLAMFSRDITERKRIEQALRESQALLQAVFDNMPCHLWARDADGVCILENPRVARVFGSHLGQRIEDLPVPADILAT